MSGFTWTDEAVAQLRQMVADQRTARQIAAALSSGLEVPVSRSAVLGKMHRLGLSSGLPRIDNAGPRKRGRAPGQPRRPKFRKPFARSLAETTASSTATGPARVASSLPVQQGEAGGRSASPDPLPPVTLPVLFKEPVGILRVKNCRNPVGADAQVIGRWLFCDQPVKEDSSWCHGCHPRMHAAWQPPTRAETEAGQRERRKVGAR